MGQEHLLDLASQHAATATVPVQLGDDASGGGLGREGQGLGGQGGDDDGGSLQAPPVPTVGSEQDG